MAPPRSKVQHRIEWQHPLTQQRHVLCVTEIKDYLVAGNTHLELTAPSGVLHPLSQTGYRSHFIDSDELAAAGGAVAFVTAWIEREVRTPQFLKQDQRARQGSLFDWADAHAAATASLRAKRPRQASVATGKRRSARASGPRQG